MKKKILLAAMGVLSLGLFLTACGTVTYNVVETDKKYEYEVRGMSGAKPDAGITIDGKMDDTAYRGLKTLTLKKNHEGQTAEIEVTTFIGKSGLYLGAQVEESTKVYYNPIRNSAYNTCIEYYFGFGDGQARGSGIFEVILSAGGQFSVRVMGKDGWENFGYKYEEAPIYAMQMAKADENGDCHAWSAEAFIPYEVFGRTARPGNVYFTLEHVAPQNNDSLDRARYNFAVYQAGYSYATEMDPTTYPYVCGRDGFLTEDIVFNVKGNGTVREENGYDRAIMNRTTRFIVKPAAGNTLKSFKVNGVDRTAELKDDAYSFICTGKIEIEAEFLEIAKLGSATLHLSGVKNKAPATIPDGELKLVDSDGVEKTGFTVTNGTAIVTDVYTINYEVYVGNSWYGQVFFESGKTEYDLTLGYLFCDVTYTPGASGNLTNVGNSQETVSGKWLDHNPSRVTVRTDGLDTDYTLTTVVKLSNHRNNSTSRLSIALSEGGDVFNIFSRDMWMIGHGAKRDLDQDNGEENSPLAEKVGAALLSDGGLTLTIVRSGNNVTVKALIDGTETTLDSFTVSGGAQIQFIVGAGTWIFSDVTVQ